jgi:hypothetical protein
MRVLAKTLALSCSLLAVAVLAQTQKKQVSPKKEMTEKKDVTDAEYTAQALSAAPKSIADGAAVVRMGADGNMKTLRKGGNGFTCMVMGTDKMCNDANSMQFIQAVMNKSMPSDKIGISYMLAGDEGASNTHPYATAKTPDNHWVVTGPHLMIFGQAARTLGYSEAKDPDPTKPYMMWAGTPYEHAMVPVGPKK